MPETPVFLFVFPNEITLVLNGITAIQMGRPSKQTYSTSKRSEKRDATEFTMSILKGDKGSSLNYRFPLGSDFLHEAQSRSLSLLFHL